MTQYYHFEHFLHFSNVIIRKNCIRSMHVLHQSKGTSLLLYLKQSKACCNVDSGNYWAPKSPKNAKSDPILQFRIFLRFSNVLIPKM